MRKISVGEFLDAMDKNGYQWTRGAFQNDNNSSCVMGQAFRNLGYEGDKLDNYDYYRQAIFTFARELRDLYSSSKKEDDGLIWYNDHKANSYNDVVAFAHDKLDPFRNTVIEFDDKPALEISSLT